MTVYIGITPDYLEQAERILNLFFSQLISILKSCQSTTLSLNINAYWLWMNLPQWEG
ncbi:hypothetical protein AFI02nite_42100 [Aliivibrio fischeri]|uniref:Uncharacterized protein n=1 Tax=Aliivibrio fischeri TaxID=668 RepID=A0A510UNG9_ALIFS|nr:hypothetical protein [Aliivibrio fischeri]GEK16174.1 hypothetical protein AFI02nite_42100 [Aliivibrio fischeri]